VCRFSTSSTCKTNKLVNAVRLIYCCTKGKKLPGNSRNLLNCPLGALAYLWLGRAYAIQGDSAKAQAAYQGFFTWWKDADPEIFVLKHARAEFAKLQ
jgi:hypothetical protein